MPYSTTRRAAKPSPGPRYDKWRISTIALNYLALILLFIGIAMGSAGPSVKDGLPAMALAAIIAWAAVVVGYVSMSRTTFPRRAKLSMYFSVAEAAVLTLIPVMTALS